MGNHHHEASAHDHTTMTVRRHCDVMIVGGSAAGLAAALQLARQRRSVIVVDAGEPRNAPAAHLHGFLSRDGLSPSKLLDLSRAEVRRYGVEVLDGRVVGASRLEDERLQIELAGGHEIITRRILVATGVVDELPEIDGLRRHWGVSVVHCPFCHGYEVRERRIVQIVTHPMGLHPTLLWSNLAGSLTTVVTPDAEVDAVQLESVRSRGLDVVNGQVDRIVDRPDGEIDHIAMTDGGSIDADVVAITPRFRPRVEPLQGLGLGTSSHASGLGDHVVTDERGETSVAGVYAAGNVTDPGLQLLPAAADGSRVGAMMSFDLAAEDAEAADRQSGNEADWEHRYSGDPIWSGNPNGALVHELADLAPGRALDVGAGEGADAMWLTEHGWITTAADISQRALERMATEADRRGLMIESLRVDANAIDAFERAGFDLVVAMYASIPRTTDRRGIDNVIGAVKPGGTLLVVSHDLEAMRLAGTTGEGGRAFDPEAYVRVEDIVSALEASPDWTIEKHERRERPPGAASGDHHMDDVVLRAHREE